MKKVTILALSLLMIIGVFSCEKEEIVQEKNITNVSTFSKTELELIKEYNIDFNKEEYKKFREKYLNAIETQKEGMPKHAREYLHIPTEHEIKIEFIHWNNLRPILKKEGIIDDKENFMQDPSTARGYNGFHKTHVPFYSEWDNNENPNGYWWCGHAALKSVCKKHGKFKTLQQIHQAFIDNSPKGYATNTYCTNNNLSWCSSIYDLEMCAQSPKWYNYKYGSSSVDRPSPQTMASWYQRLKDGVDYDRPAIVCSNYGYNVAHFYPVIGYIEYTNSNGTIDYNRSYVFLRDVGKHNKSNYYYERAVNVVDFFNNRNTRDILFVRP